MKIHLVLIFCFLSCGSLRSQNPSENPMYQLDFWDEFNALDNAFWHKRLPQEPATNEYDLHINSVGNVIPENITGTNNNYLALYLTNSDTTYFFDKDRDGDLDPVTVPYKSGTIWSKNKYLYGYYEARVQFAQGNNYWPAFWMWGSCNDCGQPWNCGGPKWYEEFDWPETFWNQSAMGNQTSYNLHYLNSQSCINTFDIDRGSSGSNYITNTNLNTQFNNFGIEWHPNFVRYYFNGVVVKTYSLPEFTFIPSHPMAVIIGIGPGNNNPYPLPAKIKVDYIRAYKLKSCANATSLWVCGTQPSTLNHIYNFVTIGRNSINLPCTTIYNASSAQFLNSKAGFLIDANSTLTCTTNGSLTMQSITCN